MQGPLSSRGASPAFVGCGEVVQHCKRHGAAREYLTPVTIDHQAIKIKVTRSNFTVLTMLADNAGGFLIYLLKDC